MGGEDEDLKTFSLRRETKHLEKKYSMVQTKLPLEKPRAVFVWMYAKKGEVVRLELKSALLFSAL
jgi:hypothetical protein